MAFIKKLGGFLGKGLAAGKSLAKKAGEKAEDLGAQATIKIESAQIKSQEGKLLEKLGNEIFIKLADDEGAKIGREVPLIRELLDEIKGLRAKMARKDEEYRAIGDKATAKA
jgi:hypothetical protein